MELFWIIGSLFFVFGLIVWISNCPTYEPVIYEDE